MKRVLLAVGATLTVIILLCFAGYIMFTAEYETNMDGDYVSRIVDGDTFEMSSGEMIRLMCVDTPEKGHRAKCPSEDQRGQAASAFTKNAIAKAQKRQVAIADWDKYGGRVLGDIILDGQSLRMMLIQNGFAREYYGEAKTSWCN